jgi:ketosteroid isomerase-like protein
MKTTKFLIGSVLAVLSILYVNQGNAQSKSALAEAKKAIATSNSIYFSSFVKNDAAIFADRYASDCIIMAPNAAPFKGRKGALAFFKLGYDAGLRNGKFITEAIYGDGNGYVTELGQWQSIDANGKVTDDGKFLVLWKKTPAGWKMFRDSFSSNHPAAK